MKPPAKRPSRKGISITCGYMRLPVSVWSGTHKPESPRTYCAGSKENAHDPQELKTLGRYCPVCSEGATAEPYGEIIKAFRDPDTKAIVPIESRDVTERMEAVAGTRDEMHPVLIGLKEYRRHFMPAANCYWITPDSDKDSALYLAMMELILLADDQALITAWTSRTVTKPYRLEVQGGMLTLTELQVIDNLRECPRGLPVAPQGDITKAAEALIDLIPAIDGEDVLSLTRDPGRKVLEAAAARAAAGKGRKLPERSRGKRTSFDERLAEASLADLL